MYGELFFELSGAMSIKKISKSLGFNCSFVCLFLPWSLAFVLTFIFIFAFVFEVWLIFPMRPYSEILYTFFELGGELFMLSGLLDRYSLVDLFLTSLLFAFVLLVPMVEVQKSKSLKFDAFFDSVLFCGVLGCWKELRNPELFCFGVGWTEAGGCKN